MKDFWPPPGDKDAGVTEEDRLETYAGFHRARVRWTAELVRTAGVPDGPILDIGASPLTPELKDLWPGREVWVLDPDPAWADRVSGSGVRFSRGSLLDQSLSLPPDYFAAAIASEVFEHLPECAPHLLARVAKVVRPGGIVGITVPNQARLANRVRLLTGRSVVESPTRAYHRPWMGYGHLHEYTMDELVREFHEPTLQPLSFGAFDPYDRGRFQPLIDLVGGLGFTTLREVLYAVFRRHAPPGPNRSA
ncbi:MAG: class I SAM-dependent methyltransferase [Thermoplasmata archaeon]|nr:class I SAM-dependent methyltransferase [Thermoplasmata archaeon]